MKLHLPQNRWFGDAPVEIDIPDHWDSYVAEMAGDLEPELSYREIQRKIQSPIGAPTITELAKNCNSACILFDDMSRGACFEDVAKIVIAELLEAGIPKNKITFICALGCHGTLELDDFVKKLGKEIPAEYPVYNHNPHGNFVDLGKTSRGVPVQVNAEVMKYDLKIALGEIVPHPIAGFGGGSKIVVPGICSIDTIYHNHKYCFDKVWFEEAISYSDNFGNLQNTDMREDAEEIAMMVGLDFKVDVLINTSCNIIDVFAGHPIKEYYEGVKKAFHVYETSRFEPVDICILNANSKSNECMVATNTGYDCLNPGGDLVLVNFCATGMVNHYLTSMWGRYTGSPLSPGNRDEKDLPNGVRRLIIFSPYKQFSTTIYFGKETQVLWADTWEKVLLLLGERPAGTRAAIFTDALLEMYNDPFKSEYVPANLNLEKSCGCQGQEESI